MSPAPTPPVPSGPAPRAARWIALALVALVAALYARTAGHDFVGYDDGSYITRNPHVQDGLTAENVRWAFGRFHSANWHPLTWLSHQLDVQLFGLAAGPHHLVSAALHALNAVLCFVFLRRATGSLWASALCALFFAVHPQRVESVAWASERKDVLSGVFFFLTLLAYERYARGPSRARYAAVAACFALGLLAKPMLVSVPLVLFALDVWPLARAVPLRTRVLEKLPLVALALGSALVTLVAQRSAGAVSTLETLTLDQRLATAVLGTWAYLRQAFWPTGLAFFYPHPALVTPDEFAPLGARVWLGALALAALTLAAWSLRRRAPALWTGWVWMAAMLLPVIGLVQVGTQFYADRYAYLPLLGLTLAVVFGLRALAPAGAQRALCALALAAAAGFAALAARQVGFWKDDPALCARALAVTQQNEKAHQLLGDYHHRRGELAEARTQYLAVLAIRPDHHQVRSNLGAVYVQLGRYAEARSELEQALRIAPAYEDALLNLGWLHEREQDPEGALRLFERAAREHPDSPAPWGKLGDAYYALARPAEAGVAFERALALQRSSAELHAKLGLALAELGEARAALAQHAAALAIAPEHALALLGEAWLRATSPQASGLRDPARAGALLAHESLRQQQPSWAQLRVAAATLAAQARFEEAVRSAAEASALAPRAWWPRLAAEREQYAARRALGD